MDYIGFLERWGRYMLRPSLHMVYRGQRVLENVSVHYPNRSVPGRYIRVWVYNFFGFPAYKCHVFVDKVLMNGKLLDSERSPLTWTDLDDYELPILRFGYRNGCYINICASDSIDSSLHVVSLKGTKGYQRFYEEGIYTIELSAEGINPCSFGRLSIDVEHDGKDWQNLKVVSVRKGKKWSRWW
jgi:hypothetical protein